MRVLQRIVSCCCKILFVDAGNYRFTPNTYPRKHINVIHLSLTCEWVNLSLITASFLYLSQVEESVGINIAVQVITTLPWV